MRVVSVNLGLPRRVRYKGRTVSTAIFKEPVAGRIPVHAESLTPCALLAPFGTPLARKPARKSQEADADPHALITL